MEIINRSPPGLVDALCKRIETLLAPSFWYEAQQFDDGDNEEYHTPHVHAQYLPLSKTESEKRDKSKDYPIVQVICNSGTISDFSETSNGSEINIQIFFGGYSKDTDCQGWRIPAAMLWRVLQDLLANTILEGYQLNTPVKWFTSNSKDKQEPPYYTAMIETVWQGSPPAVEVPEEGDLFGNKNNDEKPIAQNSDSNESGEG